MEDVMMDVIKWEHLPEVHDPKAIIAYNEKTGQTNLDRRFQTKVLSIG